MGVAGAPRAGLRADVGLARAPSPWAGWRGHETRKRFAAWCRHLLEDAMRIRVVTLGSSLLILLACGQAGDEPSLGSDQSSPGASDMAAEEALIRTLGEQHAKAVAERDTARVGDI